jgi:predicted phage terminase large subunit-like protein
VQFFRPSIVEAEAQRLSLRKFCRGAWNQFDAAKLVWGWPQDALCDHLSYIAMGDIRFLMVNIAPRTSKSSIISVCYPVWEWLQNPGLQFLTASYALNLAKRDALKSRRLIDSQWFQQRWGHRFSWVEDEKHKLSYMNDKLGRRFVTATDATATGEGGNRMIVDDPHNAREAESEVVRENTCDWWDNSLSSRLNDQDKDSWVVVGQRTHELDLFGHILETHDMREVVHLVLPNEFESSRRCTTFLPPKDGWPAKKIFTDPRTEEGELLNPLRLSKEATARQKRIMRDKYPLQYQQDSDAATGHILPRRAWKQWQGEEFPEFEYMFDVYDTAFGKDEVNDYTARTSWGIFFQEVPRRIKRAKDPRGVEDDKDDGYIAVEGFEVRPCLFLCGAWRDKLEFPDVKHEMLTRYRKTKPQWTLVENKASGISLCQELSRANVRGLRRVSYAHGGRTKMDKTERAKTASVVLVDGHVYYPDREWAKSVISECAIFPNGAHDDWVDTVTMALQWVRRLGEISLYEDEETDGTVRIFKKKPKRNRRTYG